MVMSPVPANAIQTRMSFCAKKKKKTNIEKSGEKNRGKR